MAYRQFWEIEIHHDGLNKYRHIKGTDRSVVEQKAIAQQRTWDEMWRKKQKVEKTRKQKEKALKSKEEKIALAAQKTLEAEKLIEELQGVLLQTLSINDAIDWDSLLDSTPFQEKMPSSGKLFETPKEPKITDEEFKADIRFLDKLFSGKRKKKEEEAKNKFDSAWQRWTKEKAQIESRNQKNEKDYEINVDKWKNDRAKYEEEQQKRNEDIMRKKEQYNNHVSDAILDYCEMVLANSKYPDYFPQEWDIEWQPETGVLVLDYSLPDISIIPSVKAVKYVASKDEFNESRLSDSAVNKIYDSLLYQISLRTIHELYEADLIDSIKSIVFNGWIDSIDKATGQDARACIMSVQASRDEFLAINLERVDPKACFNQLKGVGSSKLHGLSPVAPIININKEDRRFISAYSVADGMDESDNLASMDWKDFENLIREIFEKEFLLSGGEVKITQASKDGGVDAIAFDPDPIRGGKIVIQAKRYTNVVGVSSVRDLYGTIMNEGATKGILVTTANYGPDAYEFAKGKPITLLNGSNLLHLLEKHGHKARIDLKEAKLNMS
ncbi:MAG: restriction endonuclease [Hyphomicrobiales bacterium]|nr:restriction endonuclease [Hyphomicrobiales bacterium]